MLRSNTELQSFEISFASSFLSSSSILVEYKWALDLGTYWFEPCNACLGTAAATMCHLAIHLNSNPTIKYPVALEKEAPTNREKEPVAMVKTGEDWRDAVVVVWTLVLTVKTGEDWRRSGATGEGCCGGGRWRRLGANLGFSI